MVHLDRIERAILRAEAAVHADVHIDEKLCRLGDWLAGDWVVRAHDPDALRRTDLGAYSAVGT